LTKQIRLSNRAYAVADIAKLVLAGADRYRVIFRVKAERKNKPGAPEEAPTRGVQPKSFQLVRCKTDGSVWLSREEAISHVLNSPDLINEFYEVEEVATDAPKGNFAVVAVCGMSGTVLGPPNHHEYQQNIARVHRDRFGNMPLEQFKSRIKMSRDEATIEQWKQERSTARHYRVRAEKPRVAHGDSAEQKNLVDNELDGGKPIEGVLPSDEIHQVEPEAGENLVAASTLEEAPAETLGDSPEEKPSAGASDGSALEDRQTGGEANENDGDTAEPDGGKAESMEDTGATEAGDAAEAEGQAQESGDGSNNVPSCSEPAITSMVELTRHFREHFAKRIFKEVPDVRLPGTASAKTMSPTLHQRMEAEINWQKRGFPLSMVRVLCRRFENQGLKFFKRGQKTLYVSASRPRGLAADTVLTDRLLLMLNYINEHPGTLAGKLVKHLLGDKTPGVGDKEIAPEPQAEPSKVELGLLADLRWLLTEGYLIEFPSSELLPGTAVSVDKQKRRPSKRSKKKQSPKKKAPLTKGSTSEMGKPSGAPAPEAPVPAQVEPAQVEPAQAEPVQAESEL